VASKQPGSLVELKYVRAGQEHTATVRLGQRGPMGLLGSLQDIPGMPSMPSTPGMPGLRGPHGLGGPQLPGQPDQPGPGPFGNMQLRMLDPFDQADLANLLGDMQLQPGASQSLQVEIEGDQMTIERDGKTEHYRRGADGQWQPADGSTPGPDDQSKA
jgi:hypothetical protein